MLYFQKNSRFKKIGFTNIEEFKIKLNLDSIWNEELFKNYIDRNKDLYCWINPYDIEIHDTISLCWALTEEEANNTSYTQSEEI